MLLFSMWCWIWRWNFLLLEPLWRESCWRFIQTGSNHEVILCKPTHVMGCQYNTHLSIVGDVQVGMVLDLLGDGTSVVKKGKRSDKVFGDKMSAMGLRQHLLVFSKYTLI